MSAGIILRSLSNSIQGNFINIKVETGHSSVNVWSSNSIEKIALRKHHYVKCQ